MVVFSSKIHLSVFEVSLTIVLIISRRNPFLFSWRIKDIRAAMKNTVEKTKQWLLSCAFSSNWQCYLLFVEWFCLSLLGWDLEALNVLSALSEIN